MSTRGKIEIHDPAQAIAAAKCWMSRWGHTTLAGSVSVDSFHPTNCRFCQINADYLITAIDEFLDWSNLRADTRSVHYEESVEKFLMLSNAEQSEAVRAAQGY